jgi:hypothetical protein
VLTVTPYAVAEEIVGEVTVQGIGIPMVGYIL